MNLAVFIIGLIVTVIGVLVALEIFSEDGHMPGKFNKGGIFLIVLGVVVIVLAGCFKIIPTGYTGVKTTFGQIDEVTLQNGFNSKYPIIQKIELVNNKQQDISFPEQIWSETTERTALYYENTTVTYQIDSEKSAWIFANVSNYKKNLVSQPLVASAIKSASKTLASVDATNRAIIEPLAQEYIQDALNAKYGENTVQVIKVVISNADFEDSYNQAIANKQTAQLEYEKQQIENKKAVEKAEAEANVKEVNANAEKKQTEIAAEAQANATVTKAEAQAKANKMINDSVTEKVIAYMQADKWNGERSRVVVGSDESQVIIDTAETE